MQRLLDTIIAEQDSGKQVKDILKHRLQLSSRLIKKCKRYKNGILLNNQPVFVTAKVNGGDTLSVLLESATDGSEIIPVEGKIDIVFEDEDLIVINKPSPMPTHPSHGHLNDSLANLVMGYYLSQAKRAVFRPVNRLDKDTSGLIIVAKNPHVHNLLNKQLHSGDFEREYLAAVCGNPPPQGVIDAPIAGADHSIISRRVDPSGKRAVTHFKTISQGKHYSLVRLRLETGRTHQIRVHMAHIGHPLAGDFLYGTENKQLISRTALHSYRLKFIHPITQSCHDFEQPPPDDMLRLIEKIEDTKRD